MKVGYCIGIIPTSQSTDEAPILTIGNHVVKSVGDYHAPLPKIYCNEDVARIGDAYT